MSITGNIINSISEPAKSFLYKGAPVFAIKVVFEFLPFIRIALLAGSICPDLVLQRLVVGAAAVCCGAPGDRNPGTWRQRSRSCRSYSSLWHERPFPGQGRAPPKRKRIPSPAEKSAGWDTQPWYSPAELMEWAGNVLSGQDSKFKKRFVTMLMRLSEEEWKLLEGKARELVDDSE